MEVKTQESAMKITLHNENQEDILAAYDEAALRKKSAEEAAAKANEELYEIREKARAAAIAKSKAAIAQFNIKPRDLFDDAELKKKTKKINPQYRAKYRGPNGEEWSGRGLTPRWLSALIAAGRTKEEFAVAA